MSFPFGGGDRESQFRTRHTGDDSLFTAFNLSSPTPSNRVSIDASNDARATLQRRFTTANLPSVAQNVSWFGGGGGGQQRRQEQHDASNGDTLRVTPSNTLLEKKQKELDLARAQRKQVDEYLMKLEEDMKSLATGGIGHQSEPTTPPEHQESGFPNMFSRPSRFSASSVTSPPGLTSISNRTSALISSPEHERNRALEALTGAKKHEPSEESIWNVPPRSVGILNRNSMPVTRRDMGSRNGLSEYSSLGPVNTSSFLFDDEDNSSTIDYEKTPTSRNAKTFPIMSKNSDGFPVLLPSSGRMSYTGSKTGHSSVDLGSATSENSPDDGGWPASFRNSTSDSPPFGLPYPSSSSGQVTPQKTTVTERHSTGARIGTVPESQRSSFPTPSSDIPSISSAASSGNFQTPPRLQNSLSTPNVPTLKTGSGFIASDNKFHNHNVSLGRIPAGAAGTVGSHRQSREITGNESRLDEGSVSLPQGFQQHMTQPSNPMSAGSSSVTSPGDQEPQLAFQQGAAGAYGGAFGTQNTLQMLMAQYNSLNLNANLPWANGAHMYNQQQFGGYNPYQQQQQQQQQQFGSTRPRTAQTTTSPTKRTQPSEQIADFTQLPLERIKDNILELCKDQHGCRFLQKKLDEGKQESIEIIFEQTSGHIAELMVDSFGNYLVQKLLERATNEQRTVLINSAAPSMVDIALNTHGTRALQKMLEYVETREQINTVVLALENQVVRMIQDLNGNHVVQKCLNRLSREDSQFIFDKVAADCVAVGTHRHGCCVIQRCIDHASGAQKVQLVTALTLNARPLVQDPFGNYVLQYVLDQNENHLSEPLCSTFLGHIADLARQKFSSNVIEKVIRVAGADTKAKMIDEIICSPEFERLADDQYANYVVQTAWDEASDDNKARMADKLRPLAPRIRHKAHGRRYASKIQEFENKLGITSPSTLSQQNNLPTAVHDMTNMNTLASTMANPLNALGAAGAYRGLNSMPHDGYGMNTSFNMPPNAFGASAFTASQFGGRPMYGAAQPGFQNAMPPNPLGQFQQQQMHQQYSPFGRHQQQQGNGYY